MGFGFQTEPVQKPTTVPKNIKSLVQKQDPAQQILRNIFFIGTEPYNIKEIFQYAWIFPKLTQDIEKENLLKEKKNIYFFGQTEPIVINSEQVFVPVIICVKSDNEIPFQLSLTSVQASSEQIIDLNELKLGLNQVQIFSKRENKKQKDLVTLLQLNGRFDKITKNQENNYTYSNLYLPFTDYLHQQLKLLKTPESSDIEIKYDNTVYQDICVDKTDNIEQQAKFIICKYILKLNMNDLDVDNYKIDQDMLNKVIIQINQGIKDFEHKCSLKREQMSARVEESKKHQELLKDLEVVKYYPIDADEDIFIKTSGFVNRYFGQAKKIIQ
ncbi:hypothetical protein SS50377_22091 [Spironucleus salmonicida]|uniref:Uncharacterized protein n=1 Tax=Spironucleus salmonicida TaxID=348837 RepID=V6LM35_9EUKA|nr:hypothetical protein SS50377_22091 [Spironucleus salmonicida]|eukprot:EST45747.1 hypothetical protein SS50377_14318 [Spironucleus salmonicida]